MAKKVDGQVNKAEIIRSYYAANPNAKPKAIAEALKEHGVSAQYVSITLSNDRKKAGKPKSRRGRKPKAVVAAAAAAAAPAAASSSANKMTLKDLLSAKGLIEATGSLSNAKAALEAYAKLMGKG